MNKKVKIIFLIVCILIGILLTFVCLGKKKIHSDNILEPQIEKISSYNNPIVPEGFKKVETESASWKLKEGIPIGWNNGLVIEDSNGNQFVWVPANLSDNSPFDEDLEYNDLYDKDKLDSSNKEDIQIMKYEGFYIARYEAGIDNNVIKENEKFDEKTNNVEGIPVSKKGHIAWNYISWNMAKKNATKMYQNDKVESDLITNKQWSTIVNWIKQKGYNTSDSNEYGNYSNCSFPFTGYYSIDYGRTYQYGKNMMKQMHNMILSTGATERNKTNNIYDLAGNVAEFIDADSHQEFYKVCGGYYDSVSIYSISYELGIAEPNSKQGFRTVLYLKK